MISNSQRVAILCIILLAGCIPRIDASRCQPATPAQIEAINAGLHDLDPNILVKSGWWVQSRDFQNVRMVAAMLYGPGMENDGSGPGVWAMSGTPDSPAGIFSVDSVAKEFSTWEDGSTTSAHMSLIDDGVEVAQWCAANKK